ncbi:MAG: hypothetical protein E7163_01250 [Firmicutes bacterium]|nr:hypothetical protein [Bacillota bacterium]
MDRENVIFLDFDGVINNNMEDVTLTCVILLKNIIKKYNAKVVVISSILGNGTNKKKKNITVFLNNLGIYNIDFINPNLEGDIYNKKILPRLVGIIDYLRKHPNINYLIIDDEFESDYQLLGFNHLKTEMWEGLKCKDYYKISFEEADLECLKEIIYENRELTEEEKVMNNLINVLKLIKK